MVRWPCGTVRIPWRRAQKAELFLLTYSIIIGIIQNDKGKAKGYQVRQVLAAIERLERERAEGA